MHYDRWASGLAKDQAAKWIEKTERKLERKKSRKLQRMKLKREQRKLLRLEAQSPKD
jgi:hypothetical protein